MLFGTLVFHDLNLYSQNLAQSSQILSFCTVSARCLLPKQQKPELQAIPDAYNGNVVLKLPC